MFFFKNIHYCNYIFHSYSLKSFANIILLKAVLKYMIFRMLVNHTTKYLLFMILFKVRLIHSFNVKQNCFHRNLFRYRLIWNVSHQYFITRKIITLWDPFVKARQLYVLLVHFIVLLTYNVKYYRTANKYM